MQALTTYLKMSHTTIVQSNIVNFHFHYFCILYVGILKITEQLFSNFSKSFDRIVNKIHVFAYRLSHFVESGWEIPDFKIDIGRFIN
jgi:hypothetical protein